jgi:class 3 adenylate cyclase
MLRAGHPPGACRDARIVLYQAALDLFDQGGLPELMASTRRLAAILAADVAGYSRLMGVDEEGTHERLKAHLLELVDPKIKEHRGRIVKNTGDGFLAEFASVVDAVRCAAEVQRGMIEREPDVDHFPPFAIACAREAVGRATRWRPGALQHHAARRRDPW